MSRSVGGRGLLLLVALTAVGCQSAKFRPALPSSAVAAVETSAETEPSTPTRSPELAALVADLEASPAIDPTWRTKLIESLEQMDPATLPFMIATVRYHTLPETVRGPSAPPETLPQTGPTPLVAEIQADPAETAATGTQIKIKVPADAPATSPPAAPPSVLQQVVYQKSPGDLSPTAEVAAPVAHTPTAEEPAEEAGYVEISQEPLASPAPRAAQPVATPSATAAAVHNTPPDPSANQPLAVSRPAPAEEPSAELTAGDAASFQDHLKRAIAALEAEVPGRIDSDHERALAARLRLLQLVAGQRDTALEPTEGITDAEQEFWTKQMYGLSCMLDTAMLSDRSARCAQAKEHLHRAVTSLGKECDLVLRNLHFCTKVDSYGYYQPFDSYKFAPGQEVILYAEIENYVSTQSPKGFRTSLRTRYEILDSSGNTVEEDETEKEDISRNLRHDFFTGFRMYIPKSLYPGKYTLRLSIEDRTSKKTAESCIQFDVTASPDE